MHIQYGKYMLVYSLCTVLRNKWYTHRGKMQYNNNMSMTV